MRIPKYRRHSSNCAFVEWRGRRHYLSGPYNSPESRSQYKAFLTQHVLGEESPGMVCTGKPESLTIGLLTLAFLQWAQQYYPRRNGRSEANNIRCTLKHLNTLCYDLPVAKFGPRKLKEFQHFLAGKSLMRSTINANVGHVKQMFHWACEQEMISAATYNAIRATSGLRRHEASRTKAKEPQRRKPAQWKDVQDTIQYLSAQIRAMVLLQWYTGARSRSVCEAQRHQFNCTVQPWQWQLRHKTELQLYDAGEVLTLFIGRQCQQILQPFMSIEEDAYLFSPQAVATHPRYRPCYQSDIYWRAIRRVQVQHGLTLWTPHQLRHARGNIIRQKYGLEAEQAVLGHASIDATQLYGERRTELARRIAQEMG